VNENSVSLSTVENLAELLSVPPGELFRLAHQVDRCYRKKVEEKKDGGSRVYRIPNPALKKVQRLIHRRVLRRFPVHGTIYGYRKKRDVIKSAALHVGKPVLVTLDIKNFFPNIRPTKVYEMFLERGCSRPVARLLTELTTYENQLPQGPPTSPGIANQILTPLARRISGVCQKHGLAMSVYGDDIFISGSLRAAKVKNLLFRIIKAEGFSLNLKKTGVSRAGEKKIVTGISVNTKINIPKDYYRRVRATLHDAGVRGFGTLFPGLSEKKAQDRLKGMIGHVGRLNPLKGDQLRKKFMVITSRG
jgi:retron-type reverse transcriptase